METTTDYTQGTSSLLIQDRPLQVLPSLALKVGLNEAIILQQVHFWLQKSEHLYYGKQWIYNTYEDWQEQFPFWSISTIRRAVTNLEKKGYLITRTDLNKMKIDNTKWYTIDYNIINSLKSVNRPPVQNEQTTCSKWTSVSVQNEQANNHRSPKSTTKEDKNISSEQQKRSEPSTNGKLDKDLLKILKRHETLSYVTTDESYKFWDGILETADLYFKDDDSMQRWFTMILGNIDTWQRNNSHRASRSRKGLERRVGTWLSKEFMKLEGIKR